ncbi:tachylectin-related carbohydrate-binding protein [Lentzea roselyniae]|uniref:tachylectin-related carbohydrate-binding protein n=1 Tax=Lentzea roselyniae TaxID=531940 RepID=UPI0031F85727
MYQKPKRFGRSSLRNVAVVAVAATVATLVLPDQHAAAAEQIQCRESVSIYAATGSGTLLEYFHNTPESGTYDWKPQRTIGHEWSQVTIITGADGRVYQIPNNGELRRFRHNGIEWERPGGGWHTTIDTGWGQWRDPAYINRITVDSLGDIYAIDSAGKLTWSRYDEQASKWSKRVLATGFSRFNTIIAADKGVFYARDAGIANGALYRFQYHADSQQWMQYLKLVGEAGWNMHHRVFSPGGDVLYAIEPNGTLWWYRWADSTSSWSTPTAVGSGWQTDWQVGAMTDACSLSGLPAPTRPGPRPVMELERSELIESSNGLVQGFYVDSWGTLKSATQREGSPIDFLDIAAIDTPSQISTTPSALMSQDGRPNVFALGTDTVTYETTRALNGVTWPVPSSFGGWSISPTEAVKYADNRMQFFTINAQGALMARSQETVGSHVSPWWTIGFSGLGGQVTALPVGNDLEVVVTYADGLVVTSRYVNGVLTNVRGVQAGHVTGNPAGVMKNDKVQLFARRSDGKVHTLRDTTSGFETAWTALDGLSTVGSPAAVISDGKIKVAARGVDGFIYTNIQSVVDGPFTGWTKLTDSRTGNAWPSDTDPSMVALSTGKIVVMYRSADEVTFAFETSAATGVASRSAAAPAQQFIGGPSPKPRKR